MQEKLVELYTGGMGWDGQAEVNYNYCRIGIINSTHLEIIILMSILSLDNHSHTITTGGSLRVPSRIPRTLHYGPH